MDLIVKIDILRIPFVLNTLGSNTYENEQDEQENDLTGRCAADHQRVRSTFWHTVGLAALQTQRIGTHQNVESRHLTLV